MLKAAPLAQAFDRAAGLPENKGLAALRHAFSDVFRDDLEATVARVATAFAGMGLPLPEATAIVTGAVGALIPLDEYGIMLRIEQSDEKLAVGRRVDNHPMVLQPLGRRSLTGGAVLEICAGCRMTAREDYSRLLAERLPDTGVDFWDDGVTNIGLLPFATSEYPEGVPVVIERLAVDRLGEEVLPLRTALDRFNLREDVQARYQPLKDAFAQAWPDDADKPDPAAFAGFLQACRDARAHGLLVTGWAETREKTSDSFEAAKSRKVADAGRAYARQTGGPA